MRDERSSRVPATLKVTPEGVLVLTSKLVPKTGKSLLKRSLELLPRSYNAKVGDDCRRRISAIFFLNVD